MPSESKSLRKEAAARTSALQMLGPLIASGITNCRWCGRHFSLYFLFPTNLYWLSPAFRPPLRSNPHPTPRTPTSFFFWVPPQFTHVRIKTAVCFWTCFAAFSRGTNQSNLICLRPHLTLLPDAPRTHFSKVASRMYYRWPRWPIFGANSPDAGANSPDVVMEIASDTGFD